MALTQEAVKNLGARVIDHDELGPGIQLENGGVKTAHGIVIPVSQVQGGTKTGNLDGQVAVEPTAQQEQVQTASTHERKGRKKTNREQPAQVPLVTSQLTRVDVEVEGFGTIPTQYRHVYPGVGVLVLGLSDVSFVPAQADTENLRLVSFNTVPGRKYAYLGTKFTDKEGVVNIIMVEMRQ